MTVLSNEDIPLLKESEGDLRWVNDTSLQHKMEVAVSIMLDGKGALYSRAYKAYESLGALRIEDFPLKHHDAAKILLKTIQYEKERLIIEGREPIDRSYRIRPSSRQIREWIQVLHNLYIDLLVDVGMHAPYLYI